MFCLDRAETCIFVRSLHWIVAARLSRPYKEKESAFIVTVGASMLHEWIRYTVQEEKLKSIRKTVQSSSAQKLNRLTRTKRRKSRQYPKIGQF